MHASLLEMRGIVKDFPGVRSLDGVDLRVRAGTVHALMGENGAGKSTLMKCLFGIYRADGGEISLNGQALKIRSPKEALEHGIAMIHQELHPVRHRSVMENVWLGRFPRRGFGPFRLVSEAAMEAATTKLFGELGIAINPKVLIGTLSVSKIQMIEIAKAVSYQSRVIVMDEPSSSLTATEVEKLFHMIAELKSRGVAIVYISHKMEEILRIADEVTVLRDGKLVGSWPASELSIDSLITRMVGRNLEQRFPHKTNQSGAVLLRVDSLSSRSAVSLKGVSFELRRGEILGIGGLVGAQRTELIETLFGMRSKAEGTISIDGKVIAIRSPEDAIRNGMALLTEDRRESGIFPSLSVLENVLAAHQKAFKGPFGLLSEKKRQAAALASVKRLRVKTPSLKTLIKYLSGGNQQKVLLGRWLLTEPELLLLDEPTRGIDVGAKSEIYSLVMELARQGKSVIFISSEMAELIGLADRIMVMCEGRIAGILSAAEASEEKILRLATQFKT